MVGKRLKGRLLAIGVLAVLGWWFGLTEPRAGVANPSLEQTRERLARASFPHSQKDHRRIECSTCHRGTHGKASQTDEPMAKDFPHTACIRCHNFAAEIFKATSGKTGFCGACHEPRAITRSDKALRSGVLSGGRPSEFESAFSHKAHRKLLPAGFQVNPVGEPIVFGNQFKPGASPQCTDCHSQVERATATARDIRTEKGHAACFVCHGGDPPEPRAAQAEQFPYASDCRVCHELRGASVSGRVAFGTIKEFNHEDHELDIRPKKRSDFPISTAPDRLCVECHRPTEEAQRLSDIAFPETGYCQKCHIDNRPGLPSKLSEEVLIRLLRK